MTVRQQCPAAINGEVPGDLPGVRDVRAMVADTTTMSAGVLWQLTGTGRQLDASLTHLPGGQHVSPRSEPHLDVLVVVVAGSGTLHSDSGPLPLTPGLLVWLPRGAACSVAANADGLAYLAVHRTTSEPQSQTQDGQRILTSLRATEQARRDQT